MKKIILVTTIACALSHSVFAQCVVDYKTDTVTVSGEANGRVGITVFCPGMWFSDITEGVFSNDIISYNMQTTADEDGKYSFSFSQKDETGLYRYSASSQNSESEEGSFVYVSTADRETIVNALNSANETELKELCKTYQFELEISDTVFNSADQTSSAKIIASYINKNPFSQDDFRNVSDVIKTAYAAGVIASGEVKSLDTIEDVYLFIDPRIDEWMHSDKITDLRKKSIISQLKGSYTSFEELSDSFINQVVLYVVEQPNGTANLKKVISDFKAEIGVDTSKLKDSNYSAVSGKKYSSLADLEKALSPSSKPQSSGSGGGGGGGGGGAVRPSVNNNAPSVSIPPQTTTSQTTTTPIMKFEDIDSVSWAYEAIAALAREGIVSGKSETTFDPMGNVTREEFVKMLVGTLGLKTSAYSGGYNDVAQGSWYGDFVQTATENKLCNGIGDNNFGVGLPITRQDMCVMIYNSIKDKNEGTEAENVFVDGGKLAPYAREAVLALAKLDLVHGNDNKEFLPTNNTTRAEAAVLLHSLKKHLEGGAN